MASPWFISLPAWGEWHIGICLRYVVPSLRAALADGGMSRDVTFIVHTDQPERMTTALADIGSVWCRAVQGEGFPAFAQAHREAIELAPAGSNLLLHNADVIVSRECFTFAERTFDEGRRAIASVAHRCAPGDPPIGAIAAELAAWHCANRHPIAIDCMWGTGATKLPTNLFFEMKWNTVLHCFHLGPTVVRKDASRDWSFKNSIDYDLLDRFAQSEIHVVANLEYGAIEISPLTKTFPSGKRPMSVESVSDFGARRFTPLHLWLARHRILVRGDGRAVDDSPAHQIIDEIERRQCAPS